MPYPRHYDDQPRCDECGDWAEWHDASQTYLCDICEEEWNERHPVDRSDGDEEDSEDATPPSISSEYRCSKCGAQADERYDCCEVAQLTKSLKQTLEKAAALDVVPKVTR